MKFKDMFHLPKLADLGEFGRSEFASAIADIRSVLIDEGFFDRTSASVTHIERPSLGWELRDQERGADPFASRWSASDQQRERPERDHPHELDFDR